MITPGRATITLRGYVVFSDRWVPAAHTPPEIMYGRVSSRLASNWSDTGNARSRSNPALIESANELMSVGLFAPITKALRR
ncbi:MAG: hypothetical protein ABIW02_05255 [Nitrosospira sp.]